MSDVLVGYDSLGFPIYVRGEGASAGGPGGMQPYYSALEQQYGLERGSLGQIAQVESGGRANAQQGSYQGLFQMGPAEQRAYGITNPFDPWQSARGGAAYGAYNLRQLPPDNRGGFDMYMAHQQGAGGYGQLLGYSSDTYMGDISAARQRNAASQKLKGYDANTWTVGDFLGTYNTRYNTAPDGTYWPDYGYRPPYMTDGGYALGFSPYRDYSGGGGYGGFGMFGLQGTGTGYVDNSTFDSINRMLPPFGGYDGSYDVADLNGFASPGRTWVSQGDGGGYWQDTGGYSGRLRRRL